MKSRLQISTISSAMVAQVPLVFLKALDRFVVATLNAFRDTFSYQGRYRSMASGRTWVCLRAEAAHDIGFPKY